MGLTTGILGINARNLLYVQPFNKMQAIQLADNKLKTKHFLGTRDIPVAKLFAVIRSHRELERFDWETLPKNFVVKPNRGYGGEGFMRIRDFSAEDTNRIEPLVQHLHNILDGSYSLSNAPDFALVEQEIIPHKTFLRLTTFGLPDIRVIVFNRVPVMAMLRLPTRESHGTANLHQGGAIAGLDMATGELTRLYYKGEYVDQLPESKDSFHGFKIPQWDQILLIASKTQVLSNVGYLAVDIVLDQKEQPLVLELNARGGLAIQLANGAPLRRRLERIRGIKVTTPEKGVRIGKDLFGRRGIEREVEELTGKHILGNIEEVELLPLERGKPFKLLAQIEPGKLTTSLDTEIARALGITAEKTAKDFVKAEFILGGKRIKTAVSLKDYSRAEYPMIIGRRDLREFLIDPAKPLLQPEEKGGSPAAKSGSSKRKKAVIRDPVEIDAQLVLLDRQATLLRFLKPLNAAEAEQSFYASRFKKNPVFSYEPPKIDRDAFLSSLEQCKPDSSPLGQLFTKKIDEISAKVDLLRAIGTERFFTLSQIVFPVPSAQIIAEARTELDNKADLEPEQSTLTADHMKAEFEEALHRYDLFNWQVLIKKDMAADCAVGKIRTIFIKEGALFSHQRVQSLIRHEIETHILTNENGKLQPYKLFAQGFAYYLATQEGLAVYNQDHGPVRTEKYYWPAASTVAIDVASRASFAEAFATLREYGFDQQRAYQITLRAKRGMAQTSMPGACTRNYAYFAGRQMIKDFVAGNGSLKDLYIGKIALEDILILRKILPSLTPPRYLPNFITA